MVINKDIQKVIGYSETTETELSNDIFYDIVFINVMKILRF